jgi:hypothetical protein
MAAMILRACTKFESLATDAALTDSAFMDDGSSWWPAPWHVMLILQNLRKLPSTGHLVLRNTTYFYLDRMTKSTVDAIQSLPHLTHLGIVFWEDPWVNLDEKVDAAMIQSLLVSMPSLAALVAFYRNVDDLHGNTWVEIVKILDEQLFARPVVSTEGWKEIINSGAALWYIAENRCREWRKLCIARQP